MTVLAAGFSGGAGFLRIYDVTNGGSHFECGQPHSHLAGCGGVINGRGEK